MIPAIAFVVIALGGTALGMGLDASLVDRERCVISFNDAGRFAWVLSCVVLATLVALALA